METYADVPFGDEFGKGIHEVYKESIYVGYRYYQTAGKKVRYPFGYGLSYTEFAYKNMTAKDMGDTIIVTAEIENIGGFDGAEIVQLYVKAPKTEIFKPEKELRGFAKVYLKKGERKQIEITFEKSELAYFDIKENRLIPENGEYELQFCSDAETVKLCETLTISGERALSPFSAEVLAVYGKADMSAVTDELFENMSGLTIPPDPMVKPITLESRFTNLRSSFMGKILFSAVLSVAKGQMKKAEKMPEGTEKDNCTKGAIFLTKVLESNSLISMSMCAGASFPYNFAKGFMELSNGHIFRGAAYFLKPVKAPKLPKNEVK